MSQYGTQKTLLHPEDAPKDTKIPVWKARIIHPEGIETETETYTDDEWVFSFGDGTRMFVKTGDERPLTIWNGLLMVERFPAVTMCERASYNYYTESLVLERIRPGNEEPAWELREVAPATPEFRSRSVADIEGVLKKLLDAPNWESALAHGIA